MVWHGSKFRGEFVWNRQASSLTSHNPNDGTYSYLSTLNLDTYLFGLSYEFRNSEKKLRPFAGVGFGFSHFGVPAINGQPLLPLANGGAVDFNGGVKYFFSRHFGILAELGFAPLTTTENGMIVCTEGFCTKDTNQTYQTHVNVGLIIKLR
jgi:hypothetical protein